MNPEDLKRAIREKATRAACTIWGAKCWVDMSEQEREKRLNKLIAVIEEFC
ncbi:hypothetical protein [Xanthomonas phage BUDD]|nr:hypothetical protein [Xanthomonas phage BUDD]